MYLQTSNTAKPIQSEEVVCTAKAWMPPEKKPQQHKTIYNAHFWSGYAGITRIMNDWNVKKALYFSLFASLARRLGHRGRYSWSDAHRCVRDRQQKHSEEKTSNWRERLKLHLQMIRALSICTLQKRAINDMDLKTDESKWRKHTSTKWSTKMRLGWLPVHIDL